MLSAQVFTCLALRFSMAVKCFWCGCTAQTPSLAPYMLHNKLFLLSCKSVDLFTGNKTTYYWYIRPKLNHFHYFQHVCLIL